jgi:ribonuclease D
MVCGYGDSVSYETLVAKIARAALDKSSRFTDWTRRPLTERQLQYAIGDVTHLRKVYETLWGELDRNKRTEWLNDEMAILMDPATYIVEPDQAWQRIKTRTTNRRFLGVLREVAAWRELEARARDLPRGRMLKDDALLELAAHPPSSLDDMKQSRGVPKGFADGKLGPALLEAVLRGLNCPENELPEPEKMVEPPRGVGPLVELLKVMLKLQCEDHGVAQKLVANTSDLEQIAGDDDADVGALKGWRREVFGDAALALKHGKLALAAEGRRIRLIRLDKGA